MGWMSWEYYGCERDCATYPDRCISAKLYKTVADQLVDGASAAAESAIGDWRLGPGNTAWGCGAVLSGRRLGRCRRVRRGRLHGGPCGAPLPVLPREITLDPSLASAAYIESACQGRASRVSSESAECSCRMTATWTSGTRPRTTFASTRLASQAASKRWPITSTRRCLRPLSPISPAPWQLEHAKTPRRHSAPARTNGAARTWRPRARSSPGGWGGRDFLFRAFHIRRSLLRGWCCSEITAAAQGLKLGVYNDIGPGVGRARPPNLQSYPTACRPLPPPVLVASRSPTASFSTNRHVCWRPGPQRVRVSRRPGRRAARSAPTPSKTLPFCCASAVDPF